MVLGHPGRRSADHDAGAGARAIAGGRDWVDPAALAGQAAVTVPLLCPGSARPRDRPVALSGKHHALARRLLERQDDYLRFTWRFAVAPDSNGDERDIRMAKLRQKVSGCLRTLAGARRFCAHPRLPVTAAKHGLRLVDALVLLTEGRPWMPAAA